MGGERSGGKRRRVERGAAKGTSSGETPGVSDRQQRQCEVGRRRAVRQLESDLLCDLDDQVVELTAGGGNGRL